MILLLMVIVLLALAWGLSDMQLNAPIEKPEPPMPVITRKVPPPAPLEVPQAEPAFPAESGEPQSASLPSDPPPSAAGEAVRPDQGLDR
jgi:hypothetical protein